MTLQNLLQELEPLKALHPFTETNVESVERNSSGIALEYGHDTRDDDLADARENEERTAKELKACEDENRELTEQLEAVDKALTESGQTRIANALEDVEQFRKAATDWAVEVQRMRDEVTALRKKKGLMPGFISQQQKIVEQLYDIGRRNDADGLKAKSILSQIHSP